MSYNSHVKTYINKVVRIRKRLIAEKKSKMNAVLAWHHINHLEKYLKAYSFDNDRQMAGFWIRNKGRILDLLPGTASKVHYELVNEYNNIDSMTMIMDSPSGTSRNKAHVYR